MDNQKKVLKLIDYIRQVCALRQNIVRGIKNEVWSLFVDELPVDPKRICTYAPGEREDGVLLEVAKPEFTPCPELPFDLLGWIRTPNYRDFAVADIEAREEKLRHDSRLGDVMERFVDSGVRLAALEKWKRQRTLWRSGEMVKSRTQKLFMELYEIYDRCRKDPEGLELVIGNAMFLSGLDSAVNHPLLLKRVQLHYDRQGKMQVREADYPTEIYMDMFQDMPGVEPEGLREFAALVEERDIHPWAEGMEAFLTEAAGVLTPNCRYADNRFDILPTDWYLTYSRQVLFLRRRSAGMERGIASLLDYIDKNGDVPEALTRIVDPAAAPEQAEPFSLNLADIRGEAEEILLTKEANAEQLAIARKIENSPAVVVQGPPGTGKTHTIANLLGHFLAQGQHVLVTSAASKALSVLKEKLPAGIQDLCVSLIGDAKADMLHSVQGICERLSQDNPEELGKDALRLQEKRRAILSELDRLRGSLEQIQRLEAKRDYFELGGKVWSLSRMAAFIHDHQELDGIVPGEVAAVPLPLTEGELERLYGSNAVFDAVSLKEVGENLPARSELLPPSEAADILTRTAKDQAEMQGLLAGLQEAAVDSNGRLVKKGQLVAPGDLSRERLLAAQKLYATVDFATLDEKWAQEAILAGKLGGAHMEVWQMLERAIARVGQLKGQTMTRLFGHEFAYTGKRALNQEFIQTLAEMADAFAADGRLSWWTKMRHQQWGRIAREFVIDGHGLESGQDCQLALQYVALQQARQEAVRKWEQLLVPFGMMSCEELAKIGDDLDDLLAARFRQVMGLVHWQKDFWAELMLILRQAGVDAELIYSPNPFATPHEEMTEQLRWLREDYPAWQKLLLMQESRQDEADKLYTTKRSLGASDGALSYEFMTALNSSDAEAYAAAYDKLLRYEDLLPAYYERLDLMERLSAAAPAWAQAIAAQVGEPEGSKAPAEAGQAWLYAQFKRELGALPQLDVQKISGDIGRLTQELHQVTAKLAEKLAWQKLLENVSGTDLQASLVGWSKAVVKIGRGKGRYAARHIKEARECMLEAQGAVPAWIMPLARVWQNLNPASPKFDVIIIDEASQADITALPLLYFGKKVIIVGDDKQVSPAAVGVTAADITHLQSVTIEGVIKHASLYTMDTSLYDIAQMNFTARMLTEHFRCVPEIIGYSNKLAYDGRIRPLREAGCGPLQPLVAVEVPDGRRESGKKRNPAEAEAIVAQLAACLAEPAYAGKTFGVISLLGDEQAKLIRELAAEKIGISALEACDFLCGNPGNFQGDERDVIFLSLVDSAGEAEESHQLRLVGEGHGGDTVKRYNVAVSRARDQLWVFHSMGLAELKPGDLRRDLIEYVQSPHVLTAASDKEPGSLEIAVAAALRAQGYSLRQHMLVGTMDLPLVVEGDGCRALLVTQGEHWVDSIQAAAEERYNQAILERLGWQFIRVRGSEWYLDPEAALQKLCGSLAEAGIKPQAEAAAPADSEAARTELLTYVRGAAEKIRAKWHAPLEEDAV